MSDSEQHRERARRVLSYHFHSSEHGEELAHLLAAEFAAVAAEAYERGRAEQREQD